MIVVIDSNKEIIGEKELHFGVPPQSERARFQGRAELGSARTFPGTKMKQDAETYTSGTSTIVYGEAPACSFLACILPACFGAILIGCLCCVTAAYLQHTLKVRRRLRREMLTARKEMFALLKQTSSIVVPECSQTYVTQTVEYRESGQYIDSLAGEFDESRSEYQRTNPINVLEHNQVNISDLDRLRGHVEDAFCGGVNIPFTEVCEPVHS